MLDLTGDAAGQIGLEARVALVGDLHQTPLQLNVPRHRFRVAGEHRHVVQHLLVLQVGQRARLLDGAAFQGGVGTAGGQERGREYCE